MTGVLIAHIKNFYDYSLSLNCPFIPEWKKQGEDYYREKMESLRWGRDVFIPFLMQHTELTPEDEKLFAEIMATESDWHRVPEDEVRPEVTEASQESKDNELLEQAKSCIDAYCNVEFGLDAEADYTDLSNVKLAFKTTDDGLHGIQASVNLIEYRMETYIDGVLVEYTQYDDLADLIENALSDLYFHDLVSVTEEQLEPFYQAENQAEHEAEPPEERLEITMTSDAFPDLEDAYAIWDNIREEYYADDYGTVLTYPTEEEAEAGLLTVKKELAGKEAEVRFYTEQGKQGNSDLIGTEIIIDNRRYLIESIGEISGDVSLRDITFQNNVGFPINRVEKIGYIRRLLEQVQPELPPEKEKAGSPAPSADRHNYRITDDALGVGGAKEKFRNNMAAIRLLHELQIENRLATPEEQEILSKYVGWGGLSMAFDERNAAWANEYKELKAVLSEEEYRAAMESTLTAFYTPPVVIKAMYEALDRLGFSQGNILEPSCGTGNFLGLLPDGMEKSKLHGIEIDPLSGRIAKQLYQKASIAIEGFEDTKLPDDHFDVVLGNVPFGEFKVNDSRYNSQKFLIHDYFFAKALDKARAGGVVMFITSKGTMDKASPEVRKYIAQRAELLGAIRLPDNTFKANAGTEVTSDILILQKRDQIIDTEPEWVHLDTDEISDEQDEPILAAPNVRNFSFALVDGKIYFRENNQIMPAKVSMTAENRIRGLVEIRDCVRRLIQYQTDDYPEEMIQTEQKNLNRLYDAYSAKYGLINSRGNYLAFTSDESYFLLCSLEVLDDDGKFKRKADMFTKRTIKPHRTVTSVETASEALAISIGEKARVDLPFMAELTGRNHP